MPPVLNSDSIQVVINEQGAQNFSFDVVNFVQDLCLEKGFKEAKVELNFVTVDTIKTLHQDHMDDPSETDIISFNLGDEKNLDADLYICTKVAKDHATQFEVSYEKEIQLLIIHGILHCIGYDDLNKTDKEIMNQEQFRLLKKLGR